MRKLCPALLGSALLISTSALASTPPLATPADPAAPPDRPIVGAPPVLDLVLPEHPEAPPELPSLPDLPPQVEGPVGEVPSIESPPIPSLGGVVDLPEGAVNVPDLAPPFGAGLRAPVFQPIPEPGTGALLALGLLGLARRGRRSASSA